MLLTPEEIQELSGATKLPTQISWLRQNGIKFLVGHDGKPKVLRSQIEELIGTAQPKLKKRVEPNIEGLREFIESRA